VARCQAITAEDIIAAAPPSLAYNEALEVWEYTPLGRAAHDPAEYRAAVCKTLAAAMTKHYIATGRFMGHRGVPWQEFGISIARAWFNYDRRKFDGGGGAPYKGRAVEEDAVSFINGDVSTVKKRLKGSSSRTATVARWLKEYAPAELEPFLRMMSK